MLVIGCVIVLLAVVFGLAGCRRMSPASAEARQALDGPVVLSLGARVCFTEAELIEAQTSPSSRCFTAGADMPAMFISAGESDANVLIELRGVPGPSWVLRDALRPA